MLLSIATGRTAFPLLSYVYLQYIQHTTHVDKLSLASRRSKCVPSVKELVKIEIYEIQKSCHIHHSLY